MSVVQTHHTDKDNLERLALPAPPPPALGIAGQFATVLALHVFYSAVSRHPPSASEERLQLTVQGHVCQVTRSPDRLRPPSDKGPLGREELRDEAACRPQCRETWFLQVTIHIFPLRDLIL